MPSSGFQTCALDRKSTRLNSSHTLISYAVFCLKKKFFNNFYYFIYVYWISFCVVDIFCSSLATFLCTVYYLIVIYCIYFFLVYILFFFIDRVTPEITFFPLPDAFPI